jgi:hypothetical protein
MASTRKILMNHLPKINFSLKPKLRHSSGRLLTRWLTKLIGRTAIAVTLSTALTACGPGAGGTGGGPIPSASSFSGTYVSQIGSVSVAVPANTGSGVVLTPNPGASFAIVFEPQTVSLTGACLSFSSTGVRVESGTELSIEGLFKLTTPGINLASAPPLPATLTARVEGSGLQITLRDASGAILANFGTSTRLGDGVTPGPAGACVAPPG